MKRIDDLTPEQEAKMPAWAEKWIAIGLKTGKTDWEKFEKAMPVAYKKAGLEYPKNIVRVQSPLVGALAASIANSQLKSRAVSNAVRHAVDSAVGNAVSDAVGSAVDSAVDGAVGNAVDSAVGSAVDGAVGNAVSHAVGNAVRRAVHGAVSNAVRHAVGNAVRRAVHGVVRDAVGDAKIDWHHWLGGQFWVGYYWYGSPSVVSFFTDVCKLELTKDIEERAQAYKDICESVSYVWANSKFVMVCARPKHIRRDQQGRLHNEKHKAIEWSDGWGLYMLHGVRFDYKTWKKIVDHKFTMKDLTEITDVDKRAVAIQMLKPETLLKQIDAKLIHTGKKGTKLYEVERFAEKVLGDSWNESNLENSTEYCMLMQDPSTPRQFIEWVEPKVGKLGDADLCQANAWGITKEQYLRIEVEA